MQLVFSSTCATYGNPAKLPVTEETPTLPINPYGRAKLMAEQVIRDYMASDPSLQAVIFRYFNVYGSDPKALLGEFPQPSLRQHSRISGACMDAALHEIPSLTVKGGPSTLTHEHHGSAPQRRSNVVTNMCYLLKAGRLGHWHMNDRAGTKHPTRDGTCIRDFIHVVDLIDAHVLGIKHLHNPAELFNIGTGHGISVREFVDACRSVTGEAIHVVEQAESRPGDYAEVRPTRFLSAHLNLNQLGKMPCTANAADCTTKSGCLQIWADPAKIMRVMGWRPKFTNVEQSLGHAWAWRQKHPKGYPSR